MSGWFRRNSQSFIVAFVTACVVAGAPAVARVVADFAKNSDKVDGKHAVGAGASKGNRAGKLVATDKKGFLPTNILRRYQGIVIVAKSGGDFKKVQPAIDSIDNTGAGKRFLVWVAPGNYNGHVDMAEHIDVMGAGRRLTTLRCACGADANSSVQSAGAVVEGAPGTTLSSLRLVNTGGHSHVHGYDNPPSMLAATNTATTIRDVDIEVSGASVSNVGVFDQDEGTRLDDVSIFVEGAPGTDNYGIKYMNVESSLEHSDVECTGGASCTGVWTHRSVIAVEDSVIRGWDGTTTNYGMHLNGSDVEVDESLIRSRGPSSAVSYGIRNVLLNQTDTPELQLRYSRVISVGSSEQYYGLLNVGVNAVVSHSFIRADGSPSDFGILNGQTVAGGNTLHVDHSIIEGSTRTIINGSNWTARIGSTKLDGTVPQNSGTIICVNAYNGTYAALSSTCT